jgi:hypothetical protein
MNTKTIYRGFLPPCKASSIAIPILLMVRLRLGGLKERVGSRWSDSNQLWSFLFSISPGESSRFEKIKVDFTFFLVLHLPDAAQRGPREAHWG